MVLPKGKATKRKTHGKDISIVNEFLYNFFIKESIMPTIISSADLRNRYSEVSKQCHETGEAIFVTKNGKGDIAVLSIEAFDRLLGISQAREKVLKGLDQAKSGELVSEETVLSAAKNVIR